jgi:hypothetical protein
MTEVFDLVYHGGGGFNYTEVWNMDIPKRKFNIKKIKDHLDRLQEMQNENDKVLTEQTDQSNLKMPDVVKQKIASKPSYVTSKAKPKA